MCQYRNQKDLSSFCILVFEFFILCTTMLRKNQHSSSTYKATLRHVIWCQISLNVSSSGVPFWESLGSYVLLQNPTLSFSRFSSQYISIVSLILSVLHQTVNTTRAGLSSLFTVVFSGLKEKLAHGQNLIHKHLDWVEESGDLRPGWTEVKQKSDIVDSEETQPVTFLGQGLMFSYFLTMFLSMKGQLSPFFPLQHKGLKVVCASSKQISHYQHPQKALFFNSSVCLCQTPGKKAFNIMKTYLGLSRVQGVG